MLTFPALHFCSHHSSHPILFSSYYFPKCLAGKKSYAFFQTLLKCHINPKAFLDLPSNMTSSLPKQSTLSFPCLWDLKHSDDFLMSPSFRSITLSKRLTFPSSQPVMPSKTVPSKLLQLIWTSPFTCPLALLCCFSAAFQRLQP